MVAKPDISITILPEIHNKCWLIKLKGFTDLLEFVISLKNNILFVIQCLATFTDLITLELVLRFQWLSEYINIKQYLFKNLKIITAQYVYSAPGLEFRKKINNNNTFKYCSVVGELD